MPYEVPFKEMGQSSTALFQLGLEIIQLLSRPVKCLQYSKTKKPTKIIAIKYCELQSF